jgi:nucleoid-associated protein YgaU
MFAITNQRPNFPRAGRARSMKELSTMVQSTIPDRSNPVSQTRPARRFAADEPAIGYYRGRDRVAELAVAAADRDLARRGRRGAIHQPVPVQRPAARIVAVHRGDGQVSLIAADADGTYSLNRDEYCAWSCSCATGSDSAVCAHVRAAAKWASGSAR